MQQGRIGNAGLRRLRRPDQSARPPRVRGTTHGQYIGTTTGCVAPDLLNQPERLLDMLFDLNEKAATDPNYQPFRVRESSLLDEADA